MQGFVGCTCSGRVDDVDALHVVWVHCDGEVRTVSVVAETWILKVRVVPRVGNRSRNPYPHFSIAGIDKCLECRQRPAPIEVLDDDHIAEACGARAMVTVKGTIDRPTAVDCCASGGHITWKADIKGVCCSRRRCREGIEKHVYS